MALMVCLIDKKVKEGERKKVNFVKLVRINFRNMVL